MKAYLIADIDVHDLDRYKEYVALVPPFVEKHGGRYLIRAGHTEVKDGTWNPRRLILLEFPSWENAEAFINDPEYIEKAAEKRWAAAQTDMVLAQGVS